MIKKLKNKYGKYFAFEGTINGTNFFKRGIVGMWVFGIPIILTLVAGLLLYAKGLTFLAIVPMLLALGFVGLYLWFSFATSWKRINAFWPQHTSQILIIYTAASIFGQLLDPQNGLNDSIWLFFAVGILTSVFNLYLLFRNSKIKTHKG
jgi:hypothetical protein|tara:strand:+ start:288 stop:734 length:447 start_codon:yes stop_codon:yes gene_type:complete